MKRSQFVFSVVSLAAAFLLLALSAVRMAAHVDLWRWWIPLVFLAGVAVADFGSGVVHWGADTWGRDDFPIVGPRLLVPFRLHHIDPDDFLRRPFVDANGDVAFMTIPVLLALLAVPLESGWGPIVVVFGFGLCGVGMFTNQIHQWAHMPSPPRPIRLLQDCGLLLGGDEHARHHDRPYDRRYCITTGWCNRPLEAIGFFRRLESAITRATGAMPRQDDRRYEERYRAAGGS